MDVEAAMPGVNWRKRMLDAGTKLLLPEVCATCGLSGTWICAECAGSIRFVDQSRACKRCGHPGGRGMRSCSRCVDWQNSIHAVRSVYEFSGSIRDSIHRMKYRGEYARAEPHGMQIAALISELEWVPDLLIPVPLHRNRMRERGFNQSKKLAEVAGRVLAITVRDGIQRTRDTPQQTRLGLNDRRLNVEGAFSPAASLAGRKIVLIDDVTTTRSTLLACSDACLDAGASDVWALTLATDV